MTGETISLRVGDHILRADGGGDLVGATPSRELRASFAVPSAEGAIALRAAMAAGARVEVAHGPGATWSGFVLAMRTPLPGHRPWPILADLTLVEAPGG